MDDSFDAQFESQMRDVPVPDGLHARLRKVADASDENLDRWLNDVRLPSTVLPRCREIPDRAALDERIVAVDLPDDLLANIKAAALRPRFAHATLVQAALLLVMVGGGFAVATTLILNSRGERFTPAAAVLELPAWNPRYVDLEIDDAHRIASDVQDDAMSPPSEPATAPPDGFAERFLVQSEPLAPDERASDIVRSAQTAHDPWYDLDARINDSAFSISEVSAPDDTGRSFAVTASQSVPNVRGLLSHLYLLSRRSVVRDAPLTVTPRTALASLTNVYSPLANLDSGYRSSGLGRREVNLETFPDLAILEVPIAKSTTSFDALEELLGEGHWPDGIELRVEEFLAAMNFGFPTNSQKGLALHLAGCPSPFSENGAVLVQIGIKAGGKRTAPSTPATNDMVRTEDLLADAAVAIRFNPKAVRAYRLIGYETRAVEFDVPVVVPGRTLHGGDEAVVLLEVWLRSGKTPSLADVSVNWYDINAGQSHERKATLGRSQLAPVFSAAAPSLQVAAVVAETAMVLRSNRPAGLRSAHFEAIRESLLHMNHRLTKSAEFQRFRNLVETVVRVRPDLLGK